MRIPIFQVDAFAEQVFGGNPAAVCPLDEWPDDALLQSIALENNLSETAYLVADGDGYQLRWFTPGAEVDLCGHATLAAAHVVFSRLGFNHDRINFSTRSGILTAVRDGDGISIDFPATVPTPIEGPEALSMVLGVIPREVLVGFDYIAVLDDAAMIRTLKPDLRAIADLDLRGVVVTAPGDDCDFVSRCFFPAIGVDEDPVTGSAHCELTPYWAARLERTELLARQLSPRGGTVRCRLDGDRVYLWGKGVDYLIGEITVG